MGQVAERIVAKAGSGHRRPRRRRWPLELERDDDAMDDLHRALFTACSTSDWRYGVETADRRHPVGRYYERFADHAVSVARRVVYLVTGERPGDRSTVEV